MKAASRIPSAISFGVFWRRAPSTMAMMRSRKVSPGLLVTRTTIQSESTRVPPVTPLRSPPPSRITGALSPVTALSSTEAMPSITSPSAGMTSPASTSTASPFLRWPELTMSKVASRLGKARRLAVVSSRVLRSSSACALPRPSAIASAKLANSTVNQSQTDTARMKPAGASPSPSRAWSHSAVVSRLTTSTVNITGFLIWRRGSSLRKLARKARPASAGSNREILRRVMSSRSAESIRRPLWPLRRSSAGARRSGPGPGRGRTTARPPAGSCPPAAPRRAACGSAASRRRAG